MGKRIVPNQPPLVVAADVLKWFEEAGTLRNRMPDESAIEPLVALVNSIIDKPVTPAVSTSIQALQYLRDSAIHAARTQEILRKLIPALDQLEKLRPSPGLAGMTPFFPEARLLLLALDAFLAHQPPKPKGRPQGAAWRWLATDFAAAAAESLVQAGWNKPSISGNDAIVPHVVAKMLYAAFRERIEPTTIARYIRAHKKWQKSA